MNATLRSLMPFGRVFLIAGLLWATQDSTRLTHAEPEQPQEEVLTWSKGHTLLEPLTFFEKLKPTDADYVATATTSSGKLTFSLFVSADGFSQEERLDYRPECFEDDKPGCQGAIQFDNSEEINGRTLIRNIWGEEILEDFSQAQLMLTDTLSGTQRWYQGKRFNYETWHFGNNVNARFTVVSKRLPQQTRIQDYKTCLKQMCQSF
jgi:hypothetical protein